MIHQPPAGAKDLLPLEVAQKCWINDNLQRVFQRWGYQRIVTSTLERLDTLMAGGAIAPETVIQLQDRGEGTLGLRPELTASVARAAVARMGDSKYPRRLCYRANVFRNPSGSGNHGTQLEFYQAGVELLFAGGVLADAEILLLLADSLQELGLENWHLILGEAGLTRSLLGCFPEALQKQVRASLVHLDRLAIENLAISSELKERALWLFDLRGKPEDVLQKITNFELDEAGIEMVDNLKSLIELLSKSSAKPLPIVLDLSLVHAFDYYTGIVFEVVSYQSERWHILGQGGRYDRLLGVFHPLQQSSPGIGFCLNIEDLHSCLLTSPKLVRSTPIGDWLVVPKTPEAEAAALIHARQLRSSQDAIRVETHLSGGSLESIREYAASCGIPRIAWIGADGSETIEILQE